MVTYLEHVRDLLWPDGPRSDIYAVVDGARNRRVFSNLIDSYANYVCLYRGELHPELEIAAPYLVKVDFDERFTQALFREGWGNSWGIFIKSGGGLERLRSHLRRFLRVKDYSGRSLVFRYYDPRVLRAFLPTCYPDELKTLYGSIDCFYTEAEDPSTLLEFRVAQGKLEQRALRLAS